MAWYYVYLLKCADGKHYIGCTSNLKERLARHRRGEVKYTSSRLPVVIHSFTAFKDKYLAFRFEKYLKTGSGRAFINRHYTEESV